MHVMKLSLSPRHPPRLHCATSRLCGQGQALPAICHAFAQRKISGWAERRSFAARRRDSSAEVNAYGGKPCPYRANARSKLPMPAQTLKMGLIGAGRIGCVHARHLTSRIPSADLLMVADPFEKAARECAAHYAIPSFRGDYRAVLDHPDIQAVVICSSTDTHAQIIDEAAQASKHIFCEKPIALDLPSIDRALEV